MIDSTLWQRILTQLETVTGRATYNAWLAGLHPISHDGNRLVIGVSSPLALEVLQHRLYATIQRAAEAVLNRPVELEFRVAEPEPAPPPVAPPDLVPQDLPPDLETSPGRLIAQADYYAGYYERGGSGFTLLAHHLAYFWLALLGPAFSLWKILDADDTRPLKSIGPNYWTPPRKYSFDELARRLNHKHGRYISGAPIECGQSRDRRKEGRPMQQRSDCCLSPNFDLLRYTSHPRGKGLICKHWSPGLLEILYQEGLAIVQLNNGERKPTLQVWRMPPIITPAQYARFTAELQTQYDAWLDQHGKLFGINNRDFWRATTEVTLPPLMEGYDLHEIEDTFDQWDTKRSFLDNAIPNPNFDPDQEDEDEDEEL